MEATVELMSRAGCSACTHAHRQLQRILADYGVQPVVVDVDERAEQGDGLPRAEFGDRLPVIVLNGVEHSYWEVDEPRLRADLEALR